MTPNKWSETVCALSALCTQNPRIHTKAAEGEENLCLFCYNDDSYRLQTGFTRSLFHLLLHAPPGGSLGIGLALSVFRGCGGRDVNPGSRVEGEA